MANEVAALGIKVEVADLKGGSAALEDFASKGAKVDSAMEGIEKTATKTGKSLKTMGVDGAKGLQDIATAAPKVAASFGGIAKSAEDAQKALAGINSSLAGLGKVSDTANQAANGLAGFTRSLADSKKSLADMQAQVREASLAANQMGSAFANARASVQSSATSQSAVAKSTSEMGAAYKTAGDQVNAYAKAPEAAASANQRVSKSMDVTATAARSLQSAMAVLGLSFGATELIALVDGYTKFSSQLRLATNSAASYASAMESVKRISKDAQQGLNEVGTLYARIANGTAELGLSQQKLSAITEVVALSLKASGATATEASSAMLQLSQAFASGVLRGEEFNAVNEAAPRLMKALADGIGQPVGALRKMAEEGKLTAEVLANALPRALEEVRVEAAKMQTIGGSFTVLKNSMMEFFGTTSQASGAVSTITKSVELLAENLNLVTAAALGFGATKLATFLAESGKKAIENTASTAAYVTSLNQQRASSIAVAQAEASVAAARVAGLTALSAKLAAERQSALSDAASATSLTVRTNALMAASVAELNLTRTTAQLTAATTAQTVAQAALSGAITATGTAATVASRALALVGGPIGLITTALGLGVTAWMTWGNSSEAAANQAKNAVASGHHEILSRLDDQIRKLRERAGLLASGNTAAASEDTAESAKLASLNAQIEGMKKRSSELTGVEQIGLIELQGQYDEINNRLKEQARLKGVIVEKTNEASAISFLAANEDGITQKFLDQVAGYDKALAANLITEEKYREVINRLNKERVESTAAGKEAAKQSKANDSAAKAETSAYATLIASIRGKIAAYEEEARGLGAVTDGDKLRLALQAQIESGAKKISASRRAEAEADLQRLSVLEREKQMREQDAKNATAVGKEIDAIWSSADAYAQKSKELEAANEAYGKGTVAVAAMTLATKKQRLEDLEALGLTGDRTEALKAEIDEMERYVEALQGADLKSVNAGTDELVRNAKEMLSLYQSEAELGGQSAIERAKIVALRQVELKYAKELDKINKSDLSDADKETQRLKVMEAKQIESSAVVSKVIADDWNKTSQLIGDTLADYIMGGGKDAAQYLKRLFATLVLQPVVNYGVNAAMGALGLGGGQGSGGIGGIANLVSTGKSAYSAFTGQNPLLNQIGSFFGIGSSAALNSASNAALTASAESLSAAATNLATGSALDIASAEAIAASAESLTAGAATNSASSMSGMATMWPLAILAGMMVSNKLYGAGYSQKDRNGFGGAISIGNTVETNILGKIVGDKVANILTGAPLMTYVNELLGLSATAHKGAGAIYAGGDIQEGAAIYNQGSFGMGHADEYAASSQAAVSSIAANAGMTLDAIAKAFDLKDGYSVSTAFADDRSKDGAWGSLKIADELGKVLVNWEDSRESRWAPKEFANGEEGYKQYLAAVQSDVLTAIQGMDLPAWAKQIFAVSGAAKTAEERAKGLEDAIVKVSQLSAIWTSLGRTMEMFAGITGDMQTGLLMASGTMEALTTNVEAYYQGFYTEGERAQKQRELQMAALGDMGLYIDPYQGDAAKEMFRKTVEEAMASGQAEMAAQLLAMSAVFAQTTDYAQQAATEAAKAAAALTKSLRDSLISLEGQFAGGGFSRQYQAEDAASQMQALLSGAGVQMEAEALASIMMSATSAEVEHYFREIWKVLPTEAAQAELVGLANTMMDLAAATDAARASVAQAAAQSMSGAWSNFGTMAGLAAQYNGNTSGLSSQLGIVQGSYANATNTNDRVAALQQIINLEQGLWNGQQAARQAEVAAAGARANAAREQLNSAKQLLSAAQSLSQYAKSIGFGEASGLSEAERFANLEKERISLLARANAGDTEAMQELQSVTSSYLSLAQDLSSSQEDYSRLSGRIAAELEATSAIQAASASSQVSQFEQQISVSESIASSASAQFAVSEATQKLIDELLIESSESFLSEAMMTQKLIDQGVMTISAIQSLPAEIAGAIGSALIPAILALAAGPGTVSAASIPQFASGGDHFGGLRIVGENGWEVESTGPSRIFNQSQLADAFGGANENAALMNSLISELRASKGDQRVFYGEQIRVSSRVARILEFWNLSGLPEEREKDTV